MEQDHHNPAYGQDVLRYAYHKSDIAYTTQDKADQQNDQCRFTGAVAGIDEVVVKVASIGRKWMATRTGAAIELRTRIDNRERDDPGN